jgi:hypothetical protein
MTSSRPNVIWLIASLCWIGAGFLVITGVLIALGRAPLRSGAYVLEGLEVMGPAMFFLTALIATAIGFALLRRWPGGRRIAMLLFAFFGLAAVPAISSAVAEFRWFATVTEGLKPFFAVLMIFHLMQPEVVDYFQR